MFPIASNSDDEKLYVDDVFSTYLYTGNGSTQTITNGIDLAGKGGLVWTKRRDTGITPPNNANDHLFFDTLRGQNVISSNTTSAQYDQGAGFTPLSTGFSLSTSASSAPNATGASLVSWTFRKAAKFFDVVTYTGNGVAGRQIAHSLGVAPGMIIVKKTNSTGQWCVYHRGLTSAAYTIFLNLTDSQTSDNAVWNSTAPTSSVFTVGDSTGVNNSGDTYVAYLFAHDTAADGIIQCGSFPANNGQVINLGWEPQWLLYKDITSVNNWRIADTMRGLTNLPGTNAYTIKQLMPNLSNAESDNSGPVLTSTGFTWNQSQPGNTHIYMAIRRPNKPPTTGTQVYNAIARTGTSAAATITGVGFAPDLVLVDRRTTSSGTVVADRLRGTPANLFTYSTNAESMVASRVNGINQDGITLGTETEVNGSSDTYTNWFFKRAPGFFDEVCYTGTGVARTVAHNLGVAPELIIVKKRNVNESWWTWCNNAPNSSNGNYAAALNATWLYDNQGTSIWGATVTRTSTGYSIGSVSEVNGATDTYVAYLFATLAGISKVGSYTGNGSTQNIECGFAAGARFVLIKATSTTGDWLVADTARGIVTGNDPRLSLNSTAAEVTGEDWLDPYAPGFTVNQTTASANASGVSYIFLAIS